MDDEEGNPLFRKMLIFSGVFHLTVLLVSGIWMAHRAAPRRLSPVTVVDLVGGFPKAPPLSVDRAAARSLPAPPPPPPKSKASPAKPEKGSVHTVPPKPKEAPKSPPPDPSQLAETLRRMREEKAASERVREAARTALRERDVRQAVRGVDERVRRRVDLTQVRPTPRSASPQDAPGPPGAAGNTRPSSEHLAYFRALDEKVRENWTISELALRNARSMIVQVRITIEKDGRVSDLHVERSSGSEYFDDSVRRAIRKASPLPVPPEELRGRGDRCEIGFRFYGDGGAS